MPDAIGGDDPPFLSSEPPPWTARVLAWFVIVLFLAAAAGSVIVRVPETITGRFVLVPVHGNDPVRSPRRGQVTAVRVAEGDRITRGAPILVMHSDPVSDLSAELGTLRAQLGGADAAERNAKAEYEARRSADAQNRSMLEAQLASLDRSIEFKRHQRQLAGDLATNYRKGVERGLISGEEYTLRELEAARLAEDESRTEGDRAQAAAAIEKLKHETVASEAQYRETTRRLAQDRDQATIRIAAVTEQLSRSAGGEESIEAPCDGTVLRLLVRAPGAVVAEGEFLAEVACAEQRLWAEVALPQSGIGRVRSGQAVKLLYDAFPYQRFGVRRGRINWVSPAGSVTSPSDMGRTASANGSSPQFRALVDLAESGIHIDGRMRPLLAGMEGQARIVVDHRTLVSYALEPLRQLRENLSPMNE